MNAPPSSHRTLIAQYASCAEGPYDLLLNATQRVNQAYARHFGHDYGVLRSNSLEDVMYSWRIYSPNGTIALYGNECSKNDDTLNIPASRATYNKLTVLSIAMEQMYDRLLLLDADAMMVRHAIIVDAVFA